MFGKFVVFSSILLVSACGSTHSYSARKSYTMSEKEAKTYIIEMNKMNACIPELISPSEPASNILSKQYVRNILANILGNYNVSNLSWNTSSKVVDKIQRIMQKERELIPSFSQTECEQYRKEFNQSLNEARQALKEQELKRQEQAKQQAREAAARQAFYATPEGQAYLAQQRLLQQQQAMLQQQRAYQEQAERQQAWRDLNNSIQQMNQNSMNNLNQTMQFINNMNEQTNRNIEMMRNQSNWYSPLNRGRINCYNFGGSITTCNY